MARGAMDVECGWERSRAGRVYPSTVAMLTLATMARQLLTFTDDANVCVVLVCEMGALGMTTTANVPLCKVRGGKGVNVEDVDQVCKDAGLQFLVMEQLALLGAIFDVDANGSLTLNLMGEAAVRALQDAYVDARATAQPGTVVLVERVLQLHVA